MVELELVFETDVDDVEDPGEEELELVSETVVDDVASVVIFVVLVVVFNVVLVVVVSTEIIQSWYALARA